MKEIRSRISHARSPSESAVSRNFVQSPGGGLVTQR